MLAKPGTTITLISTTADPYTGSALDPSALAWLILRDGTDITQYCNVTLGTDPGAGLTRYTLTLPTSGNGACVEGNQMQVIETATVNGISASRENCRFTVVAKWPGELAAAGDMSTAVAGIGNIYSDTQSIKGAVNTTGVVVAAGSKSGYSLTSLYDAAKTAAQPNDVTGLLTTQFSLESYPPSGTLPNLSSALLLLMALLTEKAISGTTLTVYKLDGTTPAATYTLTPDDAPTAFNAVSRVG